MGLFNFKLFGGKKPDTAKIEKDLAALGLGLERVVVVPVDDEGVVRISAVAATLADKEKAIIAVGNAEHVSKVEDRIRLKTALRAVPTTPNPASPSASAPPAPSVSAPIAPAAANAAPATPAAAATVDHPEPTADEAPTSVFYTVKSGDTLSRIAKEQYGSANEYDRIFEANRPMLKHPDKIYPGQVLRIPK